MRLVIDAMCATHGGIATYVENLVGAWSGEFPDDELHVLTSPDLAVQLPASVERHDHVVRRPRAVFRPLVQTAWLSRLVAAVDADAVLATLPSTSVRRPGVPLVVVVHDLRHELRPEQFSRVQRTLRLVSYSRTYSLADAFVTISQRTLNDLFSSHPRLRTVPARAVHHGADHVQSARSTGRRTGPAIAFGHHSNKNIDLVLDAWEILARDHDDEVPPLVITGVSEAAQHRLASRAAGHLHPTVTLAGFLDAPDFDALLRTAAMIVYPSDFEGFGLPVLEAMRLGVPVVVSPDAAIVEIAGGLAELMDGWTPAALAAAVLRARDTNDATLQAAGEHAARFTWARTARETREVLCSAAGSPRARAVRRPTRSSPRQRAAPHDGGTP